MALNFDPFKEIAFIQRRTIGCFRCIHSKREKNVSFCNLIKQGLIDKDYPDESKYSCTDWRERNAKS